MLTLLLTACTTKKVTYEDTQDLDYIEIEDISYNVEEPLTNLTIEVQIDLDGICLIHLINDSDNCYSKITYKMGDKTGEFNNVAMRSEAYDYLEGNEDEIEITDYQLSDHILLNASNYINFVQFYRNDEKSYGYYNYTPIKDYHMKAEYIVLYNHHYLSVTLPIEISSYEEGKEVEETFVHWVNDGDHVKIMNPNEYLTYHFGQVELYPRYYYLERD